MAAYNFMWRQGISYPVSAQTAGEHLGKLASRDGHLTAQSVLDDSRPEDAVLHPCFEWDDAAAAEKWRRKEATDLMGNLVTIRVVERESEEPKELTVRAFSNVSGYREPGIFKVTAAAMEDDGDRAKIIENARRELQAFVRKYEALVDLAELVKEFIDV